MKTYLLKVTWHYQVTDHVIFIKWFRQWAWSQSKQNSDLLVGRMYKWEKIVCLRSLKKESFIYKTHSLLVCIYTICSNSKYLKHALPISLIYRTYYVCPISGVPWSIFPLVKWLATISHKLERWPNMCRTLHSNLPIQVFWIFL